MPAPVAVRAVLLGSLQMKQGGSSTVGIMSCSIGKALLLDGSRTHLAEMVNQEEFSRCLLHVCFGGPLGEQQVL